MPAPLRPLIKIIARRQTRANLVGQGLGHVKPEEHRKMLCDSLDWLNNIADGAFLCGKDLSIADVAVAAQVACLGSTHTSGGRRGPKTDPPDGLVRSRLGSGRLTDSPVSAFCASSELASPLRSSAQAALERGSRPSGSRPSQVPDQPNRKDPDARDVLQSTQAARGDADRAGLDDGSERWT